MVGNLWGTNNRPLNIANHPGYNSDVSAVFILGGMVLDSSWIETGDIPILAFHSPFNPIFPYDTGFIVIHSGGGVYILEITGGHGIVQRSFNLGNQQVLTEPAFLDRYSYIAAEKNDSLEGFYPFFDEQFPNQIGQWEWWDTNQVNHNFSISYNSDMSKEKALTYIDTSLFYISHRLPCILGLQPCQKIADLNVLLSEEETTLNALDVFPNPTPGPLKVNTPARLRNLTLFDLKGTKVGSWQFKGQSKAEISLEEQPPGCYFLSIELENGRVITRKIVRH